MGIWSYRPKDREAASPAPIVLRLRHWVLATFPGTVDLGAMPSAEHRRRNPASVHNAGRAWDVAPADDAQGWKIAHVLADYPDGADLQLILWKDYQWGGRAGPGWTWTGRTDHDTHLHLETRGWA